jgi:hypothetical protein
MDGGEEADAELLGGRRQRHECAPRTRSLGASESKPHIAIAEAPPRAAALFRNRIFGWACTFRSAFLRFGLSDPLIQDIVIGRCREASFQPSGHPFGLGGEVGPFYLSSTWLVKHFPPS